jgi:hypothetical protein
MKSPVKTKRFRVIMDDGNKKIDFGYDGAYTWLDGADDKVRSAYRKRHYANATEKQLIDNLVPSASLMSYYLIWGESRDIKENIAKLNAMWKKKEG